VQDGSSAREQRPRRLMMVHFTRQVTRYTRLDSSERDGAQLETDALANRQPVQLPLKLSGTGTMWHLSYYTSERVLNTLKTVEVALRRSVEQSVAVVETCIIDTKAVVPS